MQDPFDKFNPVQPDSHLDPNIDPSTDLDPSGPSGEVDRADLVTVEGQGQAESTGPVEWTTVPSDLDNGRDLGIEDEGFELLEENDLDRDLDLSVAQEESLTDEDEMDEQLIRGWTLTFLLIQIYK